ncbi:MAG: DMT family transporter [Elusimicrobia bacterium]|nr:DMT family transporter [Elusimicrobiota bacterium]
MFITRWELGLLYCAAVWGSTFYLVKEAIAGVHPVTLVAYRFLLAAALLAPWAVLRRGGPAGACRAFLRDGAGLSLLLLALYVAQTWGLLWTTASNSGFITGLFVLFVPAFMYLFQGRVPGRSQWAAVGLALGGLWLLTGGARDVNRGDALTLVAAATYAGHVFWIDRCTRAGADPLWLALHQFWMTGAAAALVAWAAGYPFAVRDPRTAGQLAFLAVFPTLSAFFLQILAQRHVEPVRASLLFTLEPVFAAAFAWTLGGETLRPLSAAGGLLIVAAMAVSELSPRPAPRPVAAPEVTL